MQKVSFTDLPIPKGTLIILDIDGTLTLSGAAEVPPQIVEKVRLLARENDVRLCSNKKKKARDKVVAEMLGVQWIDTPHRKPSVRVLESVAPEERAGKSLIVIGDKMLTDGLLAFALGAHFFWVERLEDSRAPFMDRIYYTIDNVAARILASFV